MKLAPHYTTPFYIVVMGLSLCTPLYAVKKEGCTQRAINLAGKTLKAGCDGMSYLYTPFTHARDTIGNYAISSKPAQWISSTTPAQAIFRALTPVPSEAGLEPEHEHNIHEYQESDIKAQVETRVSNATAKHQPQLPSTSTWALKRVWDNFLIMQHNTTLTTHNAAESLVLFNEKAKKLGLTSAPTLTSPLCRSSSLSTNAEEDTKEEANQNNRGLLETFSIIAQNVETMTAAGVVTARAGVKSLGLTLPGSQHDSQPDSRSTPTPLSALQSADSPDNMEEEEEEEESKDTDARVQELQTESTNQKESPKRPSLWENAQFVGEKVVSLADDFANGIREFERTVPSAEPTHSIPQHARNIGAALKKGVHGTGNLARKALDNKPGTWSTIGRGISDGADGVKNMIEGIRRENHDEEETDRNESDMRTVGNELNDISRGLRKTITTVHQVFAPSQDQRRSEAGDEHEADEKEAADARNTAQNDKKNDLDRHAPETPLSQTPGGIAEETRLLLHNATLTMGNAALAMENIARVARAVETGRQSDGDGTPGPGIGEAVRSGATAANNIASLTQQGPEQERLLRTMRENVREGLRGGLRGGQEIVESRYPYLVPAIGAGCATIAAYFFQKTWREVGGKEGIIKGVKTFLRDMFILDILNELLAKDKENKYLNPATAPLPTSEQKVTGNTPNTTTNTPSAPESTQSTSPESTHHTTTHSNNLQKDALHTTSENTPNNSPENTPEEPATKQRHNTTHKNTHTTQTAQTRSAPKKSNKARWLSFQWWRTFITS